MPRRSMLISGQTAVTSGLPALGLLAGARHHFHSVPLWVWNILIGYVFVSLIWQTFMPYLGTRYRWDETSITIITGILSTTESRQEWSEVSSVRTNQTWLHRLLTCSRIDIVSTGSDGTMSIPAVCQDEVRAVEKRFSTNHVRTHPDVTAGEPLYTASSRDLWATGFSYGQYIVIVPSAVEALDHAHLLSGHWLPTLSWSELLAGSPSAWIVLISLSVFGGAGASHVKFSGFSVTLENQSLRIVRGVFSKESTLPLTSIHGYLLHQNALMQALGLYRLDACTRAHDHKEMTSTVLPCARPDQLRTFLEALATSNTHVATPPLTLLSPSEYPADRRRLTAVCTPVLAVSALVVSVWPHIDHRILLAVLLLTFLIGNQHLGSVRSIEPGWLRLRVRLLYPRVLLTPVPLLQGLEIATGPWTRALRLTRLRAHVHAGRPTRFTALCTPAQATEVRHSLRGPSPAHPSADPIGQTFA